MEMLTLLGGGNFLFLLLADSILFLFCFRNSQKAVGLHVVDESLDLPFDFGLGHAVECLFQGGDDGRHVFFAVAVLPDEQARWC